jgi:MinD-like ATPase involved in chromosome partitioning or flagellar assembly
MLIACWSPKGGSGTTVVSAGLALVIAARRGGAGAVLADLEGDAPAALGIADPSGPGLADWLAAGADVPAGALSQLEVEAAPGLSLLPAGSQVRAAGVGRGEALATLLAADGRPIVADCGAARRAPHLDVGAGATVSLAVLRPCYLALRRALAAPFRPAGVVLVAERERSLGARDVEDVLGVPVLACVPHDSSVARAVDAGLLTARLPRVLERSLRPLVGDVLGPPRAAPGARGAWPSSLCRSRDD